MESFITVVIPIITFGMDSINFIVSNFTKPNSGKSNDGSIDLRGYSGKEAEKILKLYFETLKNE